MPWKDPKNPKKIAYQKAYYERTKNDPSRKESVRKSTYKWRETHPEEYAIQCKLLYWNNKEKILSRGKLNRQVNGDFMRALDRQRTAELDDRYIIKQLRKIGFTLANIREYPELINTFRTKLLIYRQIKTT